MNTSRCLSDYAKLATLKLYEISFLLVWPEPKVMLKVKEFLTRLLEKIRLTYRGIEYQEYEDYLVDLFTNARKEGALLDYLCTLLRVSGSSYGDWDPFVEADEALTDFSKLLKKAGRKNNKLAIRLGLLIYCHATEMAAPYEILTNLLRVKQKKRFQWDPFFDLRIRDKKDLLKHIFPSPRKKIVSLEAEAVEANEKKLIEIIRSFYDDEIRNAFYHSDYCITDDEFRIASGVGKAYSLKDIELKLVRCFAFYNAFFNVYRHAKFVIHNSKNKVFKMPDYDTLELLTNAQEGLYGFKIHHSNDTFSEYQRGRDKSHILNMSIEDEGTSVFVGEISKLEKRWKINGKELD